ncbi:MAG: GNAT family N-acetyltransferase [Luteimonas sp.]
MASYLSTRGIAWDPRRYHDSWIQFENLVISGNDIPVGVLRLLAVDGALEIRDLQVLPSHTGRGVGTWAVEQAKAQAIGRGMAELRLRVYAENPARRLYTRLGFRVVANDNGVIHMAHALPPGHASKPKSPRGPV